MINWRYIIACLIGNILEWYDFIIYAIFTGIFAHLFFPKSDPHAALLASFAVLALGYFTRPLGGILFGHIGDKYSRRLALIIALFMMGVMTTLIGVLPTYANIGLLAPLFLVLLRMLQGLAVGGEFAGTMVILVEQAPPKWRALTSTFAFVGAMAGVFLATLVANTMFNYLSEKALHDYAWRWPFLVGVVLALLGVYLRTVLWQNMPLEKRLRSPLLALLKTEKRSLITAFAYLLFPAVYTALTTVFLVPYFTMYLHQTMQAAIHLELLASLATLFSLPLSGLLADYLKQYKNYLRVSLLVVLFSSFPLFMGMLFAPHYIPLFLALFCVICSFGMGPEVVFLAKLFSRDRRYSGIGLTHGLAFSLIVGLTPLLMTWLITYWGLLTPFICLAISLIIACGAVFLTRSDTHRI